MNRAERGIDINFYNQVHNWIRKNYGSANHCEFCGEGSKRYQWALLRGFEYDFYVGNFIQLCTVCHKKYDVTEDFRNKCRIRVKNNPPDPLGKRLPWDKKRGESRFAKKLIDQKTGKIYDCALDAGIELNIKKSTLSMMLTGKNKNRTNLVYYEQ